MSFQSPIVQALIQQALGKQLDWAKLQDLEAKDTADLESEYASYIRQKSKIERLRDSGKYGTPSMRKKADQTNQEIVGKSIAGIMKGVVEGELGKARKATEALKQFLGSINVSGEMKEYLGRQIVNIATLARKGYAGLRKVPSEDMKILNNLREIVQSSAGQPPTIPRGVRETPERTVERTPQLREEQEEREEEERDDGPEPTRTNRQLRTILKDMGKANIDTSQLRRLRDAKDQRLVARIWDANKDQGIDYALQFASGSTVSPAKTRARRQKEADIPLEDPPAQPQPQRKSRPQKEIEKDMDNAYQAGFITEDEVRLFQRIKDSSDRKVVRAFWDRHKNLPLTRAIQIVDPQLWTEEEAELRRMQREGRAPSFASPIQKGAKKGAKKGARKGAVRGRGYLNPQETHLFQTAQNVSKKVKGATKDIQDQVADEVLSLLKSTAILQSTE